MTAQLSLKTLRVIHTQPMMTLLKGGTLFPDNKFPVPFRTTATAHRDAQFREEVEQILNEIALDEWTHEALCKIERALLKGEE